MLLLLRVVLLCRRGDKERCRLLLVHWEVDYVLYIYINIYIFISFIIFDYMLYMYIYIYININRYKLFT